MAKGHKQINVQPTILDLLLYAGDGISFKLNCTNSDGEPIDITGVVKVQIRLNRLPDSVAIVEFTVNNMDAYLGIIGLSLTGDQTQSLLDDPSVVNGKFVGVWDIQWTPAGLEPRTLSQGNVECVADVTR